MVDHGPASRSLRRRIGEWLLVLGAAALAGVLMSDGGPVVAAMSGLTAGAAAYAFIG